MDQFTLFRILVVCAATSCTLFGLLFLFAPDFVHRLNHIFSQELNRPNFKLDMFLRKMPHLIGSFLLLVGIPLLYMTFVVFP